MFNFILIIALIIYCVNFFDSLLFADEKYNVTKQNMFEEFLEKFKTIMRTGNDTLGLPVLDPFTVDQVPIAINEEIIKCILI